MENFKGKRALVSGGANGIGKNICEKLADLGATVFALDRVEGSYKNQLIKSVVVDLTNWETTKQVVENILPIDFLVNNVGVAFLNSIEDITESEFDLSFAVNVKATFNLTQIITTDLKKRKSAGAIVNISSQASKAALDKHAVYCATKSAVDGFTRCAALELGPFKIRINAVNPTVVMTELGRKVWGDPKVGKPMLDKIPLGRFAEEADVVDSVIFLLSDAASMITGTCLPIDGGFLAC